MNTCRSRRWTWTLGMVALAFMVLAHPAQAAEGEPVWLLRLDLSWVDPSGDFVTADVGGTTASAGFDTGFGGGVRGEYQFSDRYGVEIGVLGAGSVDVASGIFGGTVGSAVQVSSFALFTVGLNVHLTQDAPIDLYVGPLLALVSYDSVDVRTTIGTATTSVSVDNDVGLGAILGLDVPIGERGWLIQTNLRYVDTDIENSGGIILINSEFDPLIFSVGFGYRF